jgi:Tfp pilus assembly protein PilF
MKNAVHSFIIVCIITLGAGCSANKEELRKKSLNHFQLGNAYLREGKYRLALFQYQKAEKADPENSDIQYSLGFIYFKYFKKHDEAIVHLNKSISLKKDFSEAYNALGYIYLKQERWDDAISMFKKALSNIFYPTPEMVYINMGWAYYKKKDYVEAIDRYKKAMELRADIPSPYFYLGLLYKEMNNYKKAIIQFRKALEIAPKFPDPHLQIGKIYMDLRDHDRAKEAFKTVVRLAPESPIGKEATKWLELLE